MSAPHRGSPRVLHIVMMAFKEAMTAPLRARIEQAFDDVRRQCAGVMRFDLVDNHSRTSPDFTHALLSVFAGDEALAAYRTGRAHEEMMAVLGPHIERIVVLDSVLDPA